MYNESVKKAQIEKYALKIAHIWYNYRTHIHVVSSDGEAKFWLEPIISLANYSGFSKKELNFLQKTIERHQNEIIRKWKKHLKAGNN